MQIINHKNLPKPHEIMNEVNSKGYLICHDVINKDVFTKLQDYWIKKFKRKEKYKNYQRSFLLNLGDANFWAQTNKKNHDYRIKRSEFLWNEMHDLTRSVLCELHRLKNLCLNNHQDDGLVYNEKNNVCYLSINHYPPGEGCLSEHVDSPKGSIFWLIFNLTIKGKHYQEGGLYLKDKHGKKIDIDQIYKEGSVIFFDGGLPHGVDKIVSKNDIGKISFFPFDYKFIKPAEIPNYIKLIFKISNKLNNLLGLKKEVNTGLKRIDE